MSDKTPDGTPDDAPESSDGTPSEFGLGKLFYGSRDMDNGGIRVDSVHPAMRIGDTVYAIARETQERGTASVGFSKRFASNWARAFGKTTEQE